MSHDVALVGFTSGVFFFMLGLILLGVAIGKNMKSL